METELFIYTLRFPFGSGENFLETELPYLTEKFKRITILPWTYGGETQRQLPANVSLIKLQGNGRASVVSRCRLLRAHVSRKTFLKDFSYQYAHGGNLIKRASALAELVKGKQAVHYSYWLSDWATVLGLVSQEVPSIDYFSRAHGFDVYDERHPLGFQPYRAVQLARIKKVFAISTLAAHTLRRQYPDVPVEVAHLGTKDHGLGPEPIGEPLRIVSCSAVSSLKRVTDIPLLIERLGRNVHWTHIGDGPEMDLLKSRINKLPAHVSVNLMGAISSEEVIQIYKEESFHFFLHLSSSEGIPVSMMEAISFGIPIIATDVGAVHELVNEHTGHLFTKESGIKEWAEELKNILETRKTLPPREKVRESWMGEFRAEKNYIDFCNRLTD